MVFTPVCLREFGETVGERPVCPRFVCPALNLRPVAPTVRHPLLEKREKRGIPALVVQASISLGHLTDGRGRPSLHKQKCPALARMGLWFCFRLFADRSVRATRANTCRPCRRRGSPNCWHCETPLYAAGGQIFILRTLIWGTRGVKGKAHCAISLPPPPVAERVCARTRSSLWDLNHFFHFPSAEALG